jgi:hypothetical protein
MGASIDFLKADWLVNTDQVLADKREFAEHLLSAVVRIIVKLTVGGVAELQAPIHRHPECSD